MPSASLFWWMVLIGAAPFYLANRLNMGKNFEARTPRGLAIRLSETAAVLLFLATALVWKKDFPLAASAQPARYLAFLGLVLAAAGLALAGWAKTRLRSYFSVILGVQKDHELITRGPYGLARHPMYTGLLLVILGGALVHNSGAALLLLAAPFCGFFYWQSAEEEKLFAARFGEAWRRYQGRTGRFLPRLMRGDTA